MYMLNLNIFHKNNNNQKSLKTIVIKEDKY